MHQVNNKICRLVEALLEDGYEGEVRFTNSYCTGTREVLGLTYSFELTGFCKETLCLTYDDSTEEILAVGRYNEEARWRSASVEDIVSIAWNMYQGYKARGYSLPSEFTNLFIKYGYLREEIETTTIYKELK